MTVPAPGFMAAGRGSWKIVFVCDNRGAHREWTVYTQVLTFGDITTVEARGIALAMPGEVFEFSCRFCPRKPRLLHPAAVQLAGFALAGFRDGRRRVTVNICDLR